MALANGISYFYTKSSISFTTLYSAEINDSISTSVFFIISTLELQYGRNVLA